MFPNRYTLLTLVFTVNMVMVCDRPKEISKAFFEAELSNGRRNAWARWRSRRKINNDDDEKQCTEASLCIQ